MTGSNGARGSAMEIAAFSKVSEDERITDGEPIRSVNRLGAIMPGIAPFKAVFVRSQHRFAV